MKLNDYIKKQSIWFRISHRFDVWFLGVRIKLGLCPHDSSFGPVGAKIHTCLCGKEVENEDWEIEKKIIENQITYK